VPGAVDIGWVLVVDDDDLFRRRACRTLERWVPCRSASNPLEALALASENPGLVAAIVDLTLCAPPAALAEDLPNGVDNVAIPLRLALPSLDIRIVSDAVARFPGGVERVSNAGFAFMHKGNAEVLDHLGPFYARMAEDERRRAVEAQTLAGVVDLGCNHKLSVRQMEILMLKAQNLNNEQVAHTLGLSVKTIEHHSALATQKTGRSLREWAQEITPTSRTSGSPSRRPGNGRGSRP
jgi:DNA-binding NarL/FixJ family response regulator